jgi:hypothetical protein
MLQSMRLQAEVRQELPVYVCMYSQRTAAMRLLSFMPSLSLSRTLIFADIDNIRKGKHSKQLI